MDSVLQENIIAQHNEKLCNEKLYSNETDCSPERVILDCYSSFCLRQES